MLTALYERVLATAISFDTELQHALHHRERYLTRRDVERYGDVASASSTQSLRSSSNAPKIL